VWHPSPRCGQCGRGAQARPAYRLAGNGGAGHVLRRRDVVRARQAVAAYVTVAAQKAPLPNTVKFIAAAERRGIPWMRFVDRSTSSPRVRARRLDGSFTDRTGNLPPYCANKHATSVALRDAAIPVPAQLLADSWKAASGQLSGWVPGRDKALARIRAWRRGRLEDRRPGSQGLRERSRYGKTVIVEKHVEGHDHRLLVVDAGWCRRRAGCRWRNR